jgi:hypothetical protein
MVHPHWFRPGVHRARLGSRTLYTFSYMLPGMDDGLAKAMRDALG